MKIKMISAEETLPIRFAVLWPSKSEEFCRVEEDEQGLHYGAFDGDKLVCVASIFIENDSARLRKFATLHDYQGKGIGSQVLQRIISDLQAKQVRQLWCDARETAAGLYQRFTMNKCGERFYKGDVPYFRMSVEWHD